MHSRALGIAQTGNVCGALIGALMVLGFKYGGSERGKNCAHVARRLLNEFKSHNGSIICRELIGFIPSQVKDEDLQQAFQKRAFNKCQKYVKDVSKMLEKLL
ncbi:MAG: C_GCAxxG_C_C family protein [Candidatus Bathyarchaeota archaeon]|nr:MAG: C_GCAxxG_C_C family protein [Candidatus Bathyarchaeota archaeon]